MNGPAHWEREKVREREGKCMWPGVPVLIVGIINYKFLMYSSQRDIP